MDFLFSNMGDQFIHHEQAVLFMYWRALFFIYFLNVTRIDFMASGNEIRDIFHCWKSKLLAG